MPLAGAKDKMNAYVQNRAHQPRQEKRSFTPQPNSGRERSQHRQDEAHRRHRASSRSRQNNEAVTREEAAALKIEVPNTLPTSKLAQSNTQHNAVKGPAAPQNNIFSGQMSKRNEPRSVGIYESLNAVLRN